MRQAHPKCYALEPQLFFFNKDAHFKFSILDYLNTPSSAEDVIEVRLVVVTYRFVFLFVLEQR